MRLFQRPLGGHAFQRGVGGRERGVRQNRINLREQLAVFHRIASVHLHRLELSGGLGADIDIPDRLHDARRHNRAFQVAAFDGGGGIANLGLAKHPVIPQCARTNDEKCANQPNAASLQEGAEFQMTTLRRHWTCCRGGRFGFGSRDSTGRFDVRDFLCFVFCFLMSRSRRSIAGILTASSCHLPFDRSCLPNQLLAGELTLGTCWWAMGCYPPRQPGGPGYRP